MNNNTLKPTIALGFGHFAVEIYTALLIPLYPVIMERLGISLTLFSTIIALVNFIPALYQPYFGFISDRMFHRFFIVWGIILGALFIPLASMYPNTLWFSLCFFIGMIGIEFFHPQASTMVREFNKNNPKITRAMGIFLGLGTIGYALGPYIGAYFSENFGLENLFYLGIIGCLYGFLLYFLVPKIPKKDTKEKVNFTETIKDILKNKVCLILFLISLMKSIVSVSFATFISFLLLSHGFSVSQSGLIITLFFIMGGIATFTSSRFERILGTRKTIALSLAGIFPACILFISFLNISKWVSILSYLAIGFFILLSVGIILVQAQKAIPKHTGVVSGLIQGAGWAIASILLSPLGFLGEKLGVGVILISVTFLCFLMGIYCLKSKELKTLDR